MRINFGTKLLQEARQFTDKEGREMPVGETGEIRIRSGGAIKGYYKNPEPTAVEFQDGYWKSGVRRFTPRSSSRRGQVRTNPS